MREHPARQQGTLLLLLIRFIRNKRRQQTTVRECTNRANVTERDYEVLYAH